MAAQSAKPARRQHRSERYVYHSMASHNEVLPCFDISTPAPHIPGHCERGLNTVIPLDFEVTRLALEQIHRKNEGVLGRTPAGRRQQGGAQ